MKKCIAFLIIFSTILMQITNVSANIDKVAASTYYMIDADIKTVLAEKNCSGTVKPGDFSKIMTAILSLEKFNTTDLLSFKQPLNFYNSFGNILYAKKGMRLTVYEHLLNMLLLFSDASATELAFAHSTDDAAFTEEMNKKAKEIGMKDTIFSSPSGYDKYSKSKTTVYDLAILAEYAMNNETFREIIEKDIFTINIDGKEKKFSSRNHLISKYTFSNFTYSKAKGIMPSLFEDNANFIAYAENDSAKIIAIVVNSPNDSSQTLYRDVINLLNYGFNNFYPRVICRSGEIADQVNVTGGNNSQLNLHCEYSAKALLPLGYDEELITCKIERKDEEIVAPIKKGEELGKAVYSYNGKFLAEVPLVADKNVRFSIFGFVRDKLLKRLPALYLFIALLIFFIWYVFSVKEREKKRQRSKKRKEILENTNRREKNDNYK